MTIARSLAVRSNPETVSPQSILASSPLPPSVHERVAKDFNAFLRAKSEKIRIVRHLPRLPMEPLQWL